MKQEIVQAVPAASVIGATVLGISLPDWAAIFAVAFIVLQAAFMIWDRIKKK